MRVPVLTYHAGIINGTDYLGNDHVALAEDLALIQRLGLRIVPLQEVVDAFLERRDPLPSGCVALSCDDGTDYDYRDLDHPVAGPVRSFHNLMTDFQFRHGHAAQPGLHMTAFVVASPEARQRMDERCLQDCGNYSDDWWRPAFLSGRWAIENHGWDHNHPELDDPGPHGIRRGDFANIDNVEKADYEIAQARDYIDQQLSPSRSRLFCYPFGHVSDYLHDDYLPGRGVELGLDAAFCDGAEPVTLSSDRWLLPRYICGWHWKSPGELEQLLRTAG